MKKIMLIVLVAMLALSEACAYGFGNSTFGGSSSLSSSPYRAQNGDIRGADNDGDGRRETTYISGYYRKDGTYVRSHYRAAPRF